MVLTLGVAFNALGMVLMSQVSSLLHVYLVYGVLIGMGFGFSGHAAITALLSRANSPVVSAAIIDLYGRRAVGSIVGYLTMFHQLFAAAGAFAGGSPTTCTATTI